MRLLGLFVRVIALCAAFAGDGQAQPAPGDAPPPSRPVSRLDESNRAGERSRGVQQFRDEPLAPLPVVRLDDRVHVVDLEGPRVSLTFSRPLPVIEVLLLLVRGTPLSVVTEPSVTGTFIGDLKDLTMRQALEAVLCPLGLDYAVDGSVIRVSARKTETRLFELNYLAVRRSVDRRLRGTATGVADVQSTTSSGADVFTEIDLGVKALLSASGRHHVDRQAGLVHVTDFSDRLDRVAAYLEALQVRVNRQVHIETRVFEVTPKTAAGIDWAAVAARSGSPLTAGTSGFSTAGFRVADPGAVVAALAEQGSVRTIAAPRIVTMNNEPAVMRATTQLLKGSATSPPDGVRAEVSSPLSVVAGLTLTVTAQIAADGIVQLNIAPSWAQEMPRSRTAESIAAVRVSEAETVLRVRDGDTVMISGLVQELESAVLTASTAREPRTRHTELVVLLTPTIVAPGAPAAVTSR